MALRAVRGHQRGDPARLAALGDLQRLGGRRPQRRLEPGAEARRDGESVHGLGLGEAQQPCDGRRRCDRRQHGRALESSLDDGGIGALAHAQEHVVSRRDGCEQVARRWHPAPQASRYGERRRGDDAGGVAARGARAVLHVGRVRHEHIHAQRVGGGAPGALEPAAGGPRSVERARDTAPRADPVPGARAADEVEHAQPKRLAYVRIGGARLDRALRERANIQRGERHRAGRSCDRRRAAHWRPSTARNMTAPTASEKWPGKAIAQPAATSTTRSHVDSRAIRKPIMPAP